MTTIIREIRGLEVEFTGSPAWANIGIGSYECHGYKGVDNRYEVECEEYDWDHRLYTEEQNDAIDKYVQVNDDSIRDALCQKYEEDYEPEGYDCPDEDEPEHANYYDNDNDFDITSD